ncbi:MAG TPA: hypothetical protein ENI05_03985 [Porticoccus sp.]|nr:hypothetical protein [Porticoccus sp.]
MKTKTKHILIAVLLIWLSPTIVNALYQPISIVKTLLQSSMATVFSSTYDIATPAGSDSPSEADDRMRETKAAVQERNNVDHYWPLTGTEVSDVDAGEHRKATLRTGSAPTAVADKGFMYAKDVSAKAELFYRDEDGDEVQLTSGGKVGAATLDLLANNVNVAGTLDVTTSVDIAGTVVVVGTIDDDTMAAATDTTIATSESITAYIDSLTTDLVFDSDWFAVTKGTSFTKTHNLGSQILDVTVLQAVDSGGNPDTSLLFKALWAGISAVGSNGPGVRISSNTQLVITAGENAAIYYLDATGNDVIVENGHYRVIAKKLD